MWSIPDQCWPISGRLHGEIGLGCGWVALHNAEDTVHHFGVVWVSSEGGQTRDYVGRCPAPPSQ